jgi:hypothetical protein
MATMAFELQTPWANLVDRYTVLQAAILDEVDRVTGAAIDNLGISCLNFSRNTCH